MEHLLISIKPESAFATPLKGDTLFGHLCWSIRSRDGERALRELLQGYTNGKPFAVVSDPLLEHCWPRPAVPPVLFGHIDPQERKSARKRKWLHHRDLQRPLREWLNWMLEEPDGALDGIAADPAENGKPGSWRRRESRFRNSIDRRIGATSDEGFAPYGIEQTWYRRGTRLDCHIVYDAGRIDAESIRQCMTDIGKCGYGRDATVGLGRFSVCEPRDGDGAQLPESQPDATSWIALAPVAPQNLPWDSARCWYRPFTRFGRHGNIAVHSGNPFKAPVLLADTGAVLTPSGSFQERAFVGQGLGGSNHPMSIGIPETVHQGYAPVVGIHVPRFGSGESTP